MMMWTILLAIHGWEVAALFAWLWWRDRRPASTPRRGVADTPTAAPVNGVRAADEVPAIVQSLKAQRDWGGKGEAVLSAAAQEIALKGREYLSRVTAPRA